MRCVGKKDTQVWQGTGDLIAVVNKSDTLILVIEETVAGTLVLSPADEGFADRAIFIKSLMKLDCSIPTKKVTKE